MKVAKVKTTPILEHLDELRAAMTKEGWDINKQCHTMNCIGAEACLGDPSTGGTLVMFLQHMAEAHRDKQAARIMLELIDFGQHCRETYEPALKLIGALGFMSQSEMEDGPNAHDDLIAKYKAILDT